MGLKNHEKHDGCRTGPHPCIKCGKEFALMSHLKAHARLSLCSDVEQKVRCICGKYMNKKCLRKHKLICGRELTCEKCGMKFIGKRKMDSHMKHHENNNRAVCVHCGLELSCAKNLRLHTRKLHPTLAGSYKCDCCKKAFEYKLILEVHKAISHGPSDASEAFLSELTAEIPWLRRLDRKYRKDSRKKHMLRSNTS